MRQWWLRTIGVLMLIIPCLMVEPLVAQALDQAALQKGMTLPDVVQAFGQPVRIEWVNVEGQSVLFVFYSTDGGDALKQADGQRLLPLGFVTERLAGWGKAFYEQARSFQ